MAFYNSFTSFSGKKDDYSKILIIKIMVSILKMYHPKNAN